jgi:heterodisulfide reductase subunit B
MPIVFFTQLMGLAFGKGPIESGFGRELVDARPALKRIGVELPAPEEGQPRAKKAKKTGLPMPVMPGNEEVSE